MLSDEGVDHFVQRFAGHDLVELVENEMDPVVGEPPLRKIIGADAFGAIAGPDLGTPVRGALGVKFLALRIVDPGTQERHGAGAVLVLRTLVLHEDDGSRRQMGDADRGFRSC